MVYFNVLWNRAMMKSVIRGICIYASFKRYFNYPYQIVFKLSLSSEIYRAEQGFDDFRRKIPTPRDKRESMILIFIYFHKVLVLLQEVASGECLYMYIYRFSIITVSGYFMLNDSSSLSHCKYTKVNIQPWYILGMFYIVWSVKQSLKYSHLLIDVKQTICQHETLRN